MKKVLKLAFMAAVIPLTSCQKEKTIDDELKQAAADMNKLTPQILNDGIRLDSVSTEPDRVFKYNYTLTDDVKENVTPEQLQVFKKEAKDGALEAVKTSEDLREFRDRDVILRYSYYDKNGKLTADFSITPEEYKAR
ncbi:hypothetical protein ODZ84_12155 [Chryseobacterium fluminis]|uniref:hypothetical protein n=1 Tax=Chryseobacterium fluminis TaxID=2983606 RepID=UPI00224D6F4C|nr:hypothetical protein [Chryseobacterium sp. MMS21-Ot14]UZT95993.1 hypothetical protein ODZ84_12155 [Chryseobacterium sp. MMS21-Ot14]